ncbi:MAG: hypothetical protein ABSF47_02510 [Minisyncoccia bacterium]
MTSETRNCQNCKQNFVIESDDFDFYEKMKVPAPTFCPDCRLVRKLIWRNERVLYRRECDLCNKSVISIYPKESPLKVYCHDCWWGDKWDPQVYAAKFNPSKPFFEQYRTLVESVPVINLFNTNPVNSEYCNYASNSKNCYLFVGGRECENILYANRVFSSKDSIDLYDANKLELSYEAIQCKNCNRLFFGQLCTDCNDSWFLYDCRGCQNCFGCANLRGQQYHIWNQPYQKEDYFAKLKEFDLESRAGLEKAKKLAEEHLAKYIRRYAHIVNSPGSTGDNLYNCRNCKYCFDLTGSDSESCKFTHFAGVGMKDSYDNYGAPRAEQVYETLAIGFESNDNSHYYFSYFVRGSHDIYYSYNCVSSSYLFGCVGLRNKQYRILNKQYTKEEYEELVPKIIQQMNDMPFMDKRGLVYKYGEFPPAEFSPFAYNETIAQDYFPITKDEAIKQGYLWKDPETKAYQVTIPADKIPERIKDVPDAITSEVIACAHAGKCTHQCTTAFRIILEELQFYRRMDLPLPRLCSNCRHYERLAQRNPMRLWHRKCQCAGAKSEGGAYQNTVKHQHQDGHCPNEFETSYSPERKEIIYCEQCYNSEVI